MAKKKQKRPTKEPGKASKSTKARATIRVYRHGLGDCILICLKKRNGDDFKILIDCGVAVATTDSAKVMNNVVQDLFDTTDGKLDVLAVTHEHWDHVSGFDQAEELFGKFKVGEIWLAWTEDPADALAKELRAKHSVALRYLDASTAALAAGGRSEQAANIQLTLGLRGAAGEKTRSAFDIAKSFLKPPKKPRFWRPGIGEEGGADGQQTSPLQLEDPNVTIYALGPPHDRKLLNKTLPSKVNPETFEFALDRSGILSLDVIHALEGSNEDPPFSRTATIPFEAAKAEVFFQNHYFGVFEGDEDWRRIDTDWLGAADALALAMQSATNNTSLVLAIEFPDNDVLLFVGDAQVGNWLSWGDLSWQVGRRTVKASDLLARTIFYKVGHHGSHNATLKEKGLDLMDKLQTAVIPVDHVVAKKMRWGAMPLTSLIEALEKKTPRVLRTDIPPAEATTGIKVTDLYYEISV